MFDALQFITQLKQCNSQLLDLKKLLSIDKQREELIEVIEKLQDPAVWQDIPLSSQLGQKKTLLEKNINQFETLQQNLSASLDLSELALEEDDSSLLEELSNGFLELHKQIADLEFHQLFNGELDSQNCYVEIQSGSGGTEAQDWAEMLLRQYLRWIERHEFKAQVLDYSAGEVAGIKTASIHVKGDYAYGWLRTESGIHRLVRKSPFDSSSKRHTSFASVFISPEIDDSFEIDLNPTDIRVDVYRASGAGGQHVNRTESAVRLTHLPTNTVTQCQNSRSQHANKAEAMKQLRAKLYDIELKKRGSEKQELEDSKADIGWGSQIRSYILDSGRVKDLRTGTETGNTQSVLDGDIDLFIKATLKKLSQPKTS